MLKKLILFVILNEISMSLSVKIMDINSFCGIFHRNVTLEIERNITLCRNFGNFVKLTFNNHFESDEILNLNISEIWIKPKKKAYFKKFDPNSRNC